MFNTLHLGINVLFQQIDSSLSSVIEVQDLVTPYITYQHVRFIAKIKNYAEFKMIFQ